LNELQILVNRARRLLPRGWSPLIRAIAHLIPRLQQYRAKLSNGDQIYLDLRENMCHGIFYYGSQPHESGTEKLFRKVLRPGNVAVDIGANIGYYTRILSRLVGVGGTVIAFEPLPAAFKILEMNCTDLSNTKLFPLALSDREGQTNFYIRKNGDMSSLNPDAHANKIRVKTTTADKILKNYEKLDLIKIDVEGFELEVIYGAQELLSIQKPIVYFEFLHRFATERGFRFEEFETLLSKYDYVLKWVDHTTATSIFSNTPSNYVIAVPNNRLHVLH
jgi:FkbM family methyltransferase